MSKVLVIDVNLGQDIESIIADDIKTITDKNIEEVENATKTAPKAPDINRAPKTNDADIKLALGTIYERLLKYHESGSPIAVEDMMTDAGPIKSSSAMIMRLKNYIRIEHENDYVLKKCSYLGKSAYKLIEFNVTS